MSSAPAAVSLLVTLAESSTSKASRYFPLTPVRPTSTLSISSICGLLRELERRPTGAQDHHLRPILTVVGLLYDEAQLIAIEAHRGVVVVNRYDQPHLTHGGASRGPAGAYPGSRFLIARMTA